MSFDSFLVQLVIILAAAKIGGEIAERLRQPAVLGELVAGVLVGGAVLGRVGPLSIDGHNEVLNLLAEIGAVLLLFEAGLESDTDELRRLGPAALWVAVAGILLPFGMGFGVGHLLHLTNPTAIFLGAALTATSVGITARTFADLKMGHTPEARIVLGSAVADDVLGLILLALVSGMAGGAARSPFVVVGLALVFLVGSMGIGIVAAPGILKIASKMRTRAALATSALAFCFLYGALAHVIGGLAPIVGAFAAGLVLARTEHRLHLESRLKPVADLFIPIFFVVMGAKMPLKAMPLSVVWLTLGLIVVAIVGKVLGGLTVPVRGVNRLLVGFGMIPRGEVGLIFANVGLSHNLITTDMFTAIVLTVMATTFVTPPLLQWAARRNGASAPATP
jgi:Kef-type K+ transport system membrane component KefB